MTKFLGAHVSAAGGPDKAVDNALAIGATAFALFVKNQRQWNAKPLTENQISLFKDKLAKSGIKTEMVLPHAGYLINLGAPQEEKREKSLNSFIDEMKRCSQLGLTCVNIHPGSHLREISEQESLDLVTVSLEKAMSEVHGIKIILETTAGQGSNLGYKFDHLGYIISKINDKKRIGTCIDTCHSFCAGYDFKSETGYNLAMQEFEKHIGIEFLCGVHLNDTKNDCNTRKDRHELIGKGFLEIDFFKRFMNDKRFDNVPIILETPDPTIWKQEIEMLYNFMS